MDLRAGAVLIIVIVFMAVTSSGASEMVAISSLFTFDVYRRYIDPKVRSDQVLHASHTGDPNAEMRGRGSADGRSVARISLL